MGRKINKTIPETEIFASGFIPKLDHCSPTTIVIIVVREIWSMETRAQEESTAYMTIDCPGQMRLAIVRLQLALLDNLNGLL